MSAGMLPYVTEQHSLSQKTCIVSVGDVNEIIAENKACDIVEHSSLYAPDYRHYSKNYEFRNITGNEPNFLHAARTLAVLNSLSPCKLITVLLSYP